MLSPNLLENILTFDIYKPTTRKMGNRAPWNTKWKRSKLLKADRESKFSLCFDSPGKKTEENLSARKRESVIPYFPL